MGLEPVALDGDEEPVHRRNDEVDALGLPFVGSLPMFTQLRENSDLGEPGANFEGHPQLKETLEAIVRTLAGQVILQNMQSTGPELTIS